jgi:CxxC-x17-CxxC domain-containing protein
MVPSRPQSSPGREPSSAADSVRGPGPCVGQRTKTGKRDRHIRGQWPISASSRLLGKPAMEFTDKVLKCVDCSSEFIFTAGEQLFFHDKDFKNDPKRCKQCKAKRASGGQRVRTETRTNCSACGLETTVPFRPTQGRPVLCRSCFQKNQLAPAAAAPSPAGAAT